MKRLVAITLLAIVVFITIGSNLSGATRLWAFTGFWLVYLTILGLGIAYVQLKMYCRSECHGERGGMKVALTFDDGPDPASTPALLDLLKKQNVPAAFFCIGKRAAAHRQIVARIAAEGHLIGNHTFHHYWYTAMLGPGGLSSEIEMTQDVLADATGIRPRYMRPPMGMTNPHYARILRRLGLTMIGWDVRSLDTRKSTRETIDRVLRQTRDGSIILLHDGGMPAEHVIQIVSEVVRELRDRGFSFERVDRLIGSNSSAAQSLA